MEFALYMLVILLFCVIAVGAFFHNTIVAGLKDELLTAETRLRAAFMSRSKVAQNTLQADVVATGAAVSGAVTDAASGIAEKIS